jgi:hypothetical protein
MTYPIIQKQKQSSVETIRRLRRFAPYSYILPLVAFLSDTSSSGSTSYSTRPKLRTPNSELSLRSSYRHTILPRAPPLVLDRRGTAEGHARGEEQADDTLLEGSDGRVADVHYGFHPVKCQMTDLDPRRVRWHLGMAARRARRHTGCLGVEREHGRSRLEHRADAPGEGRG